MENGLRKSHLFTSESVSMGHPDKVADQISDAILDSLLEADPHARVACETLVTTGLVVLAGEITVHNQKGIEALNNAEATARETIREIGYTYQTAGLDDKYFEYMDKALEESKKVNFKWGIQKSKLDEASYYEGKAEYDKAIVLINDLQAHRIRSGPLQELE